MIVCEMSLRKRFLRENYKHCFIQKNCEKIALRVPKLEAKPCSVYEFWARSPQGHQIRVLR